MSLDSEPGYCQREKEFMDKAMKRQLKFIESEITVSEGRAGKLERGLPHCPAGWGLDLLTSLGVEHS